MQLPSGILVRPQAELNFLNSNTKLMAALINYCRGFFRNDKSDIKPVNLTQGLRKITLFFIGLFLKKRKP